VKTLVGILFMLTLTDNALAQSPGHYANVTGLKMYYEVHGNGFPLVLIHGGGSTIGSNWGRVLPALAKTHKVIAVEMQAHGHTADINRPLSFEQDADDVAELLKQLHIAKADIFGFSNGASTTLEMAIRHPDLVNKIIVASTMYKKDGAFPGFWDIMAHATFEGMPQPLKDAFLEITPNRDALFTMYKRDVARMQSFKDIKEADIKAIKAPALIVIGDHDVVRPEHAVEMFRQMQHATLVILPGGHGDYLGEITTVKPGNSGYPVLPVIETFLNETARH
jgi:pimeloyl-ACP methyl ester carboxylesterase